MLNACAQDGDRMDRCFKRASRWEMGRVSALDWLTDAQCLEMRIDFGRKLKNVASWQKVLLASPTRRLGCASRLIG